MWFPVFCCKIRRRRRRRRPPSVRQGKYLQLSFVVLDVLGLQSFDDFEILGTACFEVVAMFIIRLHRGAGHDHDPCKNGSTSGGAICCLGFGLMVGQGSKRVFDGCLDSQERAIWGRICDEAISLL